MIFCGFLILLIIVFIFSYFLCVRKGLVGERKACWLLPLGAIVAFVFYCLYCPYCWLTGLAILVVSLIVYIALVLKA